MITKPITPPLPTLAEELPGAFPETGDDPSGDEPDSDSDNGDDGGNQEPPLLPETPINPEENPLQALANMITEFSHATQHGTESTPLTFTIVWEPDTFNSSDPKKLHQFLVQCQLNFQDRQQAF